jgi:two-component system phosphate regulon sensor histidine kinase PhoR
LLVLSLALLFCAAIFIFFQTSYKASSELLQEFEGREAKTLNVVQWLVTDKAPYSGTDQLRLLIAEISKKLDTRVTYIANGKVLAESDLPPAEAARMEDHSDRPEVIEALKSGFGKSTRYSSTLQTEMLYMATRMQGTAGLPDGILRIAVPYSTVQDILSESRTRFMAVIALMAACASALGVFLIRRTQGMLRSFSQVVDELGREDSPDKIRVCPSSEFKPLMDSIHVLANQASKSHRYLPDTRSQFEAGLAKMTDAVAVLDQDGNILAHNAALEQLLDTPAASCVGRNVLESGLGLGVYEAVRDALATRSAEPRRIQARLAGGKDADVDLVGYATSKGKSRLILVLHDVTTIKNAERILREFVINASHQLRTPLTSIQGYAATLLDSPPEDQEQARSMLSTILKKSQDMSGVVTGLLDTATPQSGAAPGKH